MEKIQIVKLRKISLLVEDIKQKFCFRFICACQVSAHLVNMLYHVFLVHDLPVNLLMCHWCFYYFTLLWLVYCLFKMFFLYLLNQKGFCCRLSCCILQTQSFLSRYRSSHQCCSMKKGVLRNFAEFTGKHLYQSLVFNKVAGLRPATLLKKRLWHRCFTKNFAKFLRTPFLRNTSGRLLLQVASYQQSRAKTHFRTCFFFPLQFCFAAQ